MTDAPPLAADVYCIDCGYNLCGLSTDALCPECAAPVERSLHGDSLHFANRTWLKRIRLGVGALLTSQVLLILTNLGTFSIGLFSPMIQRDWLGAILSLLNRTVESGALFLIASPEPRESSQEGFLSLRRVVRSCAISGLLLHLALAFLKPVLPDWPSLVQFLSQIPWMIVTAVGPLAALVLLRRIAARAQRRRLVRATTRAFIAVATVETISFAQWLYFFTAYGLRWATSQAPSTLLLWLTSMPVVAGFIVCIWPLILFARYRRCLRRIVATPALLTETPTSSGSIRIPTNPRPLPHKI